MTSRARLAVVGVGCLVTVFACGGAPTTSPAPLRILFIGNSLTSSNDVPAIVQAMARDAGVDLRYEACTPGGVNLEDHWNDGHCRKLLEDQRWDFVVLQQGPSSRDASRADLRKWSARWADAIRTRGARPALYMVWPQQGQPDGFARVGGSYRIAADESRSVLLPAGDAWRDALAAEAPVRLYSPDALHPTVEGSYLAALVIAHHLAGVQPAGVPARLKLSSGNVIELAPDDAAALRRAAPLNTPPKQEPRRRG